MVNQQLQTIQDKLQQKNELPRGSKEREDLVNEIKSQVSTICVPSFKVDVCFSFHVSDAAGVNWPSQ